MASIPPLRLLGVASHIVSDDPIVKQLIEHIAELENLVQSSPFRVVEMALEMQVERIRVMEVLKARDVAVGRLADAYTTVRRYSEFIDQLQQDRVVRGLENLKFTDNDADEHTAGAGLTPLDPKAHIAALEATIKELREINGYLKEYDACEGKAMCDPPPHYEENLVKLSCSVQTENNGDTKPTATAFEEALKAIQAKSAQEGTLSADDIPKLIESRYNLLRAIPLPHDPPDITLSPIVLPAQVSLHEFLNGAPNALRNVLGNYRTFQNVTAEWCPDMEEHGFMYVPMFKCSTNPRTITAHRWNAVDVVGRLAKPTECFYSNNGTWYYAGVYKAFLIDTVSTAEWETLSNETKTAIVKDTLSARKNTTPQINYETSQLYAAGALRLACVGLQCIGFNREIYTSILELSTKLAQSNATAAVAAASSSVSKSPISPTTSTPGSLPKSKFTSSPLFNAFGKASLSSLSQGSSTSGISTCIGSPNNSVTSGTPPMMTGGLLRDNDFGGSSLLAGNGNTSGTTTFDRLGLCTTPSSKVNNSPLSSHGSGACTPNSLGSTSTHTSTATLAVSSGISPIARPSPGSVSNTSHHGTSGTAGAGLGGSSGVGGGRGFSAASGGLMMSSVGVGAHGLGTGSPIWNTVAGSNLGTYLNSLAMRPGNGGVSHATVKIGNPGPENLGNGGGMSGLGGSEGLGFGNVGRK